ncbi:MAG TPA: HAD family hydrolase [Candidatus Brocadiia bacterium]|nr:HAD family hydrolase [Candidatus Brocadiia bacterium]
MARLEAVILDLDDTLMPEMAVEEETYHAVAAQAARRGADPGRFVEALKERAQELWRAFEPAEFCRLIGMGWFEGLRSSFAAADAPAEYEERIKPLRQWAPEYRRLAWSSALAEAGVRDERLAGELGRLYAVERERRHRLFEETVPVLLGLKKRFRLGLLTNGAIDIQRAKIAGGAVAPFFDAIVITGELCVGKPDPRPFHTALSRLGVEPGRAAMVGNSLTRDVETAHRLGMAAVWVAHDMPAHSHAAPIRIIRRLAQLPAALDR